MPMFFHELASLACVLARLLISAIYLPSWNNQHKHISHCVLLYILFGFPLAYAYECVIAGTKCLIISAEWRS
jgi:hypothetical protein